MRDRLIEQLFSLLTSADRAEAIAGDLAEEREHRGWAWFWLHALGVTLELWKRAVVAAPLRVLALTIAACALLIAPAFGGAVAAFLFPQMIAAWWLLGSAGALFTAISLAAVARRLGFAASATLAVVGVLFVLACLIVVPAVAAVTAGGMEGPIAAQDIARHRRRRRAARGAGLGWLRPGGRSVGGARSDGAPIR